MINYSPDKQIFILKVGQKTRQPRMLQTPPRPGFDAQPARPEVDGHMIHLAGHELSHPMPEFTRLDGLRLIRALDTRLGAQDIAGLYWQAVDDIAENCGIVHKGDYKG